MENKFYKGLHPEDIDKLNEISKSIRENMIKVGLSMTEAAKRVVRTANDFNEVAYRLMESSYLEEHGELPDVSRESQRWAVTEWFVKEGKKLI